LFFSIFGFFLKIFQKWIKIWVATIIIIIIVVVVVVVVVVYNI
jgi:hypothetical protein